MDWAQLAEIAGVLRVGCGALDGLDLAVLDHGDAQARLIGERRHYLLGELVDSGPDRAGLLREGPAPERRQAGGGEA